MGGRYEKVVAPSHWGGPGSLSRANFEFGGLLKGHLGERIAEGAPWLNKAHYY